MHCTSLPFLINALLRKDLKSIILRPFSLGIGHTGTGAGLRGLLREERFAAVVRGRHSLSGRPPKPCAPLRLQHLLLTL